MIGRVEGTPYATPAVASAGASAGVSALSTDGSKRWKISDPRSEGQDEFAPQSAKLLADGRTVELTFKKLVPVMQMQVGYNLDTRDGRKAVGSVYLTINTTGK